MASIRALISAVLMPPLRRTGGHEVIEDAGIIEAVVMRALLSNRVRGLGTPVGVHPRHSDVTRFTFLLSMLYITDTIDANPHLRRTSADTRVASLSILLE
ncbi:hypothetical protein [Rhodococcus opacus]|uniref:hypothetical protein n=1 Tax=Rhodococcus opacus TaxID=37919 RepID=UPI00030DBAF9|nr:hypothetical protein [Rhodococcus opacus]AHK35446.1 hypothetical protein Pd630_LPD09206 [Rhodococcus opacus PD630]UDH01576.1 hypothetical protein K2Z90_008139 [Rhodococcus opacus PD630]